MCFIHRCFYSRCSLVCRIGIIMSTASKLVSHSAVPFMLLVVPNPSTQC